VDLLLQVTRQNHVLERGKLGIAQRDPLVQTVDHGREVRYLRAHPFPVRLRSAGRRIRIEVELPIVDVGHLGQALAQGIEANDVGVHRTQPHGHRVHPFLELLLEVVDLLLLVRENLCPVVGVTARQARSTSLPQMHPKREGPTEQPQSERRNQTQRERMSQIELAGGAPALEKKMMFIRCAPYECLPHSPTQKATRLKGPAPPAPRSIDETLDRSLSGRHRNAVSIGGNRAAIGGKRSVAHRSVAKARIEPCPGVKRPVLVEKTCTLLATPLSWLLALDRWFCAPAFRRVCP